MIYQGKTIHVTLEDNNIARMLFDAGEQSVNKFDLATLDELKAAITTLAANKSIRGMYVDSAKSTFIVGADITQFHSLFDLDEAEIVDSVKKFNQIFSAFEQLPFPTVAVVNGVAVGGGFEMILACDYRLSGPNGRFGLPEVKLGINPGFGGTIRLPRLIGIDNAVEWIAGGAEQRASAALKAGAVDAVVADDKLRDAALDLVRRAIAGELDFRAKRQPKLEKIKLNTIEQMMAFETTKGFVAGQAGPNYPAPVEAIKTMQKAANHGREKALEIEAAGFAKMAKTTVAASLVGLFLNDQALKSKAKKYDKLA